MLVQAQADLLQVPVLVGGSADATALGVAALARLGAGEAATVAEALGPAEAETIVEPAITADDSAERMAAFRSALQLTLPGR
jgi:glycerol kinase